MNYNTTNNNNSTRERRANLQAPKRAADGGGNGLGAPRQAQAGGPRPLRRVMVTSYIMM